MKNKIVLLIVFSILLLSNGLSFIDSAQPSGEDPVWLDFFVFWLTGVAFMFMFYFFIDYLKRTNDKVWKPLGFLMIMIGFFLHLNYSDRFSVSEDGVVSLFKQPIMWMLIASVIGYLAVFIYRRNKQQIN